MGVGNGRTSVANSSVVPQKVSLELPYDHTIPVLCTCPRELKTQADTKTYTEMIIATLFIIDKKVEITQGSSVNEWINGKWFTFLRFASVRDP